MSSTNPNQGYGQGYQQNPYGANTPNQMNQQYGNGYNAYQNAGYQQGGYQGNYQNPPMGSPVINAQPFRVTEKMAQRSITRAYGEMTIALLISAVVAAVTAYSGLALNLLRGWGQLAYWGAAIVALVFAFVLPAGMQKRSVAANRALFYAFAAVMGFSLSTLLYVYSPSSIIFALGITAAFFLCLTMIGLTTKINVLRWGPVLTVSLLVLVIAEILLMIFGGSQAWMLVTAVSLIIFSGMTIHDAKSTQVMLAQCTSQEMYEKISILAAMNLYLDFINLFQNILYLIGGNDR
jgi:FtsH-binding integral membrane protein